MQQIKSYRTFSWFYSLLVYVMQPLSLLFLSFFISSQKSQALHPYQDITRLVWENCPNHRSYVYSPRCIWNSGFPLFNCETIPVQVNFIPKQFQWIDDKLQEFTVLLKIKVTWPLYCDDLEHPDQAISVNIDTDRSDYKFWSPKLLHMNAVTSVDLNFPTRQMLFINPKNSTTPSSFRMVMYGLLTSKISMKFNDFPFDQQLTEIVISLYQNTFINYISEIDLTVRPESSFFMPKGMIWEFSEPVPNCTVNELENYATFRNRKAEASVGICQMLFKRKSQHYIYSYLLPCFFLTSVQLISFCIPGSATDRPVFTVTLLLSLTLVQGEVQSIVPVKEERTFLTDYTQFCMLLSWLCTVYNLVICGFQTSFPEYFNKMENFSKLSKFTISKSRLFDLVAFTISSILFFAINAYALTVAISNN